MRSKFFLTLLLSILAIAVRSQSRSLFIDSLVISPSLPTTKDSTLLEAHIYLPYWTNGQKRYSDTIIYTDSQIIVSSCYIMGQLPTAKAIIDSSYFKHLPASTYNLTYYLHTPLYNEVDTLTDCSKYPYYDSASIAFTITDATGISTPGNEPNLISILPNPVSDILNVQLLHTIGARVEIVSVTGQPLVRYEEVEHNLKIPTAQLPLGTYFVIVTDNMQRAVKRFMKL